MGYLHMGEKIQKSTNNKKFFLANKKYENNLVFELFYASLRKATNLSYFFCNLRCREDFTSSRFPWCIRRKDPYSQIWWNKIIRLRSINSKMIYLNGSRLKIESKAYMECWMASMAVDEGKNSSTATSLFSFFLSNQELRNFTAFAWILLIAKMNFSSLQGNRKHVKGYSLQRSDGFQQDDEVAAGWCRWSGGTRGHQHILQWSCHLSLPIHTKNLFRPKFSTF